MHDRQTSIRTLSPVSILVVFASFTCAGMLHAGDGPWITLIDETATRLVADASVGTGDIDEKDYAWGDIDQDGDIDLVCVRKQPFTSPGGRRNVLFMNEGIADGQAIDFVLVDRTIDYFTDSDSNGLKDFLELTNDRDVALVDVNGDDWLDIVTATTLSDTLPKTISHPRVYINQGEVAGIWQGFVYEETRIPHMESGTPNATPRFCSVAAGDLTGDGRPDLYFGDYDSGGSQILDFNNRLLINDGNGFFADETAARLTPEMRNSAFGAASVIADINDDGAMDVVKQTSLNAPQHIAVTYNSSATPGTFTDYDVKYALAPYFVSVDDLNNDGMLDLVITDDGTDTYLLNQGNDEVTGLAEFSLHEFPENGSQFGGNSLIADLDNDCHLDVIITDVDVDITGCTRLTNIYRNLGNLPAVTFLNESEVIPAAFRNGIHDVAVFDLNNDGWLDIVSGRCDGMEIWMQTPPPAVVFGYPNARPVVVQAGQTNTVTVELRKACTESIDPTESKLFYSVDGGGFSEAPLTNQVDDTFDALLPALPCGSIVEYYFEAAIEGDATIFRDPPAAPASLFELDVADLTETLRDEVEGAVDSWTITSDGTLTSGTWEAAVPNGTVVAPWLAAPDKDNTLTGTFAFVTENGVFGGAPGTNDIDGGATYLVSPTIDLSAFDDAEISFARWFFTLEAVADNDFLRVEVSDNNGTDWELVDEVSSTIGDPQTEWDTLAFRVSDYVALTNQVQVRFTAADTGTGTIAEAGIDDFVVTAYGCTLCPADIAPVGAPDGVVNVSDLLVLLAAWGDCPAPCAADTNGDLQVNVSDLLILLAAWGPCS